MSTTLIPKFPIVRPSLHSILRERVNSYFAENKISPTGNYKLFIKATIFIVLFLALYINLLWGTHLWYIAIPECVLLGLMMAGIGFNILHDGSHGSFSKNQFCNWLAASTLNVLGGNVRMWDVKHNVLHHSFTNVDGVDDDITVGMLMRLAPTQKRYAIHRFQHLYFPFLYMLLYIFWVFYTDYLKYFTGKIGAIPMPKMSLKNHIAFWMVKIYHAIVFILLPIYLVGWAYWLIGFLIVAFVAGYTLSIIFQLAHTVEGTSFPKVDDNNQLPTEFATHQIKTTADFATKSKIMTWLLGGLNFQVEHHLFPKVSHIHYPAINKIVRQSCKEYELQYLEHSSVHKAVMAHARFLKSMGKKL